MNDPFRNFSITSNPTTIKKVLFLKYSNLESQFSSSLLMDLTFLGIVGFLFYFSITTYMKDRRG